MKHLEELEKELKWLLESYICHSTDQYIIVKQHNNLSNNEEVVLFKLLLERKILQAYDAIEERKRYITYLNITYLMVEVKENDNDEVGRLITGHYLKEQIEEAFKKHLTDYEWEWLSKHEGKDEVKESDQKI